MTADRPALERLLRLLPAGLYMLFIWGMSAVPGADLPALVDDRIAHTGEYALLALLALFALTGFSAPRIGSGTLAVAFAWSCGWGVVDEIHQSFTPGRDPSLSDLFFDAAGSLGALALAFLVARRAR